MCGRTQIGDCQNKTDRIGDCKKSPDLWQPLLHRTVNAQLTCVVRCVATEFGTCVCDMPMTNHSVRLDFLPRIA